MHPIIYSEIKQTQTQYKSILFLIFIMVVCRAAFGDYGHLLNLFFFFPVIAGALGTGVLSQEYSKDYLKYLFSLPIKRWHFILIKIIASVVSSAAFLLVIYIIRWTIPPSIRMPEIILPTVFSLRLVLVFSASVSLFGYAVGTFAITFFKSPKWAGSLGPPAVITGIMYLLYCFLDTGHKYSLLDYITIFTPTSAILLVGGFHLFTLRNPFLNRNPRHLITGIFLAALSAVYFAGSARLICHEPSRNIFESGAHNDDPVSNRGVEFCSVSPDGEFVFVQTSTDGIISHSYISDSSGRLVADLGRNSSTAFYNMLWQFNNGRRMAVYKIEKLILSEISRDRFSQCFVLDLDASKRYPFKNICGSSDGRYREYKVFNTNTLKFSGVSHAYDSDSYRGLRLFKQDIVTGSVDTRRIPNGNNLSVYECKTIDHEHIAFESRRGCAKRNLSEPPPNQDSRRRINIFNLETDQLVEILLPEEAYVTHYQISNGKCYFVERLSDEEGYSYRVACCDEGNLNRTYIGPEVLPRVSYKEAAERKGADVYFYLRSSPLKKWVECYYADREGQRRLLLIDQSGNTVDANITSTTVFSPEETRFYVRDNDSGKDVFQIYDIVDQRVVFIRRFEVDDGCRLSFLNDTEMIYVEDPTPNERWPNDNRLMRLDLRTMKSMPFF